MTDRLRTAKRNASEDRTCQPLLITPKISVAALLELASWCEQRLDDSYGGEACLTTKDGPQTKKGASSGRPEPAVEPAFERRPQSHCTDCGADDCPADSAFAAEGGI